VYGIRADSPPVAGISSSSFFRVAGSTPRFPLQSNLHSASHLSALLGGESKHPRSFDDFSTAQLISSPPADPVLGCDPSRPRSWSSPTSSIA